ncbi:lysylphosphatidylglycerol synthase transmembrane domain-containing protein [Geodermatophilus sp. SYSU D00708]
MRRLWPYLRLLVGAGIVAALLVRLGSDAVVQGFRGIGARAVLAALGIGLLTTVLSACRWCLVARGLGLTLPLPGAVADCYRALFLNSVLPGGVLGDVHRAVSSGRRAGDVGRGVLAVALERSAGLVVTVVVAVGVLLTRPELLVAAAGSLVPGRGAAATLAVVLAVAAVLGVAAVRGGRAVRARAALGTGLAAVRSGVLSLGTWPGVVLASAAATAAHLALFVVAARAAGARAGLGDLLPLLVLALLAMALPFSVGGWGPREAVAALGFGATGLGATTGFTVALVYGVLSLVSCLPGAAVLLLRRPAGPATDEDPPPRLPLSVAAAPRFTREDSTRDGERRPG